VGSTGSGKSWTTARLVEQIAGLPNANAILLDVHGEYRPLNGPGIQHLRIAGTADLDGNSADTTIPLFLPYWLLPYEDMLAVLADREDSNAPNQAMVMSRAVNSAKRRYLENNGHRDVLANFTIDSPVPYDMQEVLDEITAKNTEMVPGSNKDKQGDFYGKLSRLIARMESRIADRKLGFMFQPPRESLEFGWLENLARTLMAGTRDQRGQRGGVKIIDFSEVPSDILPVVVGRLVSIIFSVAQWTPSNGRHPIAMLCDEAHLYIPERASMAGLVGSSLQTFHRVAKEGRKYGVGLVIISQRPSEVSRTVLSQCNNFVAMRLTNAEDQSVVQRLLPDNLSSLSGVLPILDTGEALVVGDACSLPTRIRISEPRNQPDSRTVDFWDVWSRDQPNQHISRAVQAWRRQSSEVR
jgi:DNA helicase HerA-like ATPase